MPIPISARDDADQLDQAGQSILQLRNSAAVVAEQDGRRTLHIAQKLAYHLHAAEDRITELEAEGRNLSAKGRASGAMAHRIYTEIEDRFVR